jgi:hypothetical protein
MNRAFHKSPIGRSRRGWGCSSITRYRFFYERSRNQRSLICSLGVVKTWADIAVST